MGYRSNVSICCLKKAYEKFKAAYEKYNYKPDEVEEISKGIYILTWKWTKWYEDYDNVIAIDNVMDELSDERFENDKDCAFKFIRIGEQTEDFEILENAAGMEIFTSFYPYMMINFPNEGEVADGIAYWEKYVADKS